MQLPKIKRRVGSSSALVIAGLAMTGFESWNHLAGLVIGCVVVALALIALFVPEAPAGPQSAIEHIHRWERTLRNPHGEPPRGS